MVSGWKFKVGPALLSLVICGCQAMMPTPMPAPSPTPTATTLEPTNTLHPDAALTSTPTDTPNLTNTPKPMDALTPTVEPTLLPAPYELARRLQLPEGYVAEKLFVPPLAGIIYIARSQSGVVYISHFIHNAGISLLDLVEKKAIRILDLPSEAGHSIIVGGPGDTALIAVNEEIWQVYPDGSHTIWGRRGGRPQYLTSAGRLLGTTHDGTAVIELLPNGDVREIAAGFSNVFNVVASTDGKIYVSEWGTGNITRIDPDGSRRVLVQELVVNDPIDLGVDEEGNLYFNSSSSGPMGGFVKVDATTGAFTHYDLYSQTCTEHLTDFVFSAPGKVIFVDPTISQVTWDDLNTHEGGLLISSQGANTHAADIGPDDALYIGTRGCGADLPARVVRIGDDGTRTVYADGLEGDIRDIAFDHNGGLYIATSTRFKGGGLFYVPSPGSDPVLIPGGAPYNIVSIAADPLTSRLLVTEYGSDTILEFTLGGLVGEHPIRMPKKAAWFIIDVSVDGLLYAFVSEWERRDTGPVVERWLLTIDVQSGTSDVVFQYGHEGCCVMGNLDIDRQGNIWWLVNPEFEIYRITPMGNSMRFAQNLPIDAASIQVDSQGHLYFTSSDGIYRISGVIERGGRRPSGHALGQTLSWSGQAGSAPMLCPDFETSRHRAMLD